MPLTLGEVNKKIEELEKQIGELRDIIDSVADTTTIPNASEDEYYKSTIGILGIPEHTFLALKKVLELRRIEIRYKHTNTYMITGTSIGMIRDTLNAIDDTIVSVLMVQPIAQTTKTYKIEVKLPTYLTDEHKSWDYDLSNKSARFKGLHKFIEEKVQWITLTAMKYMDIEGSNIFMRKLDKLFHILNWDPERGRCGRTDYCDNFPYDCPGCSEN